MISNDNQWYFAKTLLFHWKYKASRKKQLFRMKTNSSLQKTFGFQLEKNTKTKNNVLANMEPRPPPQLREYCFCFCCFLLFQLENKCFCKIILVFYRNTWFFIRFICIPQEIMFLFFCHQKCFQTKLETKLLTTLPSCFLEKPRNRGFRQNLICLDFSSDCQ